MMVPRSPGKWAKGPPKAWRQRRSQAAEAVASSLAESRRSPARRSSVCREHLGLPAVAQACRSPPIVVPACLRCSSSSRPRGQVTAPRCVRLFSGKIDEPLRKTTRRIFSCHAPQIAHHIWLLIGGIPGKWIGVL